jgi:hypothetical protein
MMVKGQEIVALLSTIDIQQRGWMIVDHWEGDLCAIGIARISEPRRLVYVSTFNKNSGRYDYECEAPSGPNDPDYVEVDRGQDVTLDELLDALVRHLGCSN